MPPEGMPDPEDVFDRLRREDGERMGSIEMSAAGRFIPYDRLWVRRRGCAQPPEYTLPAGAVTGPGAAIGTRSPERPGVASRPARAGRRPPGCWRWHRRPR